MSRPNTPGYSIRRPPLGSGTSSRAGTPLGKPVISLEEWEARSPLSDEQVQSITFVRDQFSERKLPDKFTQGEPSSRPGTPRRFAHSRTGSGVTPGSTPAPSSPVPGSAGPGPSALGRDPLNSLAIVTPQQFHDHFAALALSAEHEQDSLYRAHLGEMVALREKCDGLIELLGQGEGEVGDMLHALDYVEERSESLRGACEDLLEEQTHLLTHTSELAHRLSYFTFLDTAQRLLNNPGNELVLSPDFLPMVTRLDECISYLGEHRDFKDAEIYLIRYQQCMTRSMTLIRLHFVSAVKALGLEIGKRTADKSLSDMTARGLLYNRFSSLSTSLRPLIAQLEQRIPTNGAELEPILADCHIAWVTTRQALMGGRVGEEITRLNPTRGELVDLTRAGCSYLKQTCMDEFNLFKQFFLSGEQMLYGFLETLCDHLYDHIRPRILHEPSLTVLQEVCTVLQALMVHDVDDDDDDSDEVLVFSPESPLAAHTLSLSPAHESGDYFGPFTSPGRSYRAGAPLTLMSTRQSRQSTSTITPAPRRYRRPLARLHTELLLKMVLQDTQTRLVFRAQALIQTDVQYYVPKTGDLDYPAKLGSSAGTKAVSKPENSVSLDDDYEDYDDRPALLSLPPPAEQETWYPPLRSTLWVLSCLYTYIDIAVFTDLAQEAVLTCRQSLTAASETMGAKAADSPAADAKLFLVRHLLILKEMTAGLDLGRARAREWAGVTDFLRSLLDNASSLLGYRSHTPRDFAPDVKTDLDRELKRACEDLIAQCTAAATAPLTSFLSQCTAFLSAGAGAGRELPAQSWASPQAVADVHAAFRTVAEDELRKWRAQLMLYLQDEETVRVLVPPAQAAIVDAYRQFHDLVRAEYDFSCAAALSTPSAVAAQLSEVR